MQKGQVILWMDTKNTKKITFGLWSEEKKVGKGLFIVKTNKFNWNLCNFGKNYPLIFGHVGGKIK